MLFAYVGPHTPYSSKDSARSFLLYSSSLFCKDVSRVQLEPNLKRFGKIQNENEVDPPQHPRIRTLDPASIKYRNGCYTDTDTSLSAAR